MDAVVASTLATTSAPREYEWIHRAVENREAVRLIESQSGIADADEAVATPDDPGAAAWLVGLVVLVVAGPALVLAAERLRTRWREVLEWRPQRDPLERAFRAARTNCALNAAQITELKARAAGTPGAPGPSPIAQLLAPSARTDLGSAPAPELVSEPKPVVSAMRERRQPKPHRRPFRVSFLVADSARRSAPRREAAGRDR